MEVGVVAGERLLDFRASVETAVGDGRPVFQAKVQASNSGPIDLHHPGSVLQVDVPSYRTAEAQADAKRPAAQGRRASKKSIRK